MPRAFHTKSILRHIPPDEKLELSILIGNAQHGEWWVWVDAEQIATGTGTKKQLSLGTASEFYDKLIQVEVRCDDTNPNKDRLNAIIKLEPTTPAVEVETNNAGQDAPHASMTTVVDIFVMPVVQ